MEAWATHSRDYLLMGPIQSAAMEHPIKLVLLGEYVDRVEVPLVQTCPSTGEFISVVSQLLRQIRKTADLRKTSACLPSFHTAVELQ